MTFPEEPGTFGPYHVQQDPIVSRIIRFVLCPVLGPQAPPAEQAIGRRHLGHAVFSPPIFPVKQNNIDPCRGRRFSQLSCSFQKNPHTTSSTVATVKGGIPLNVLFIGKGTG